MILKKGNYIQDILCPMKEMFLTFPTILQVKWTYPGVPVHKDKNKRLIKRLRRNNYKQRGYIVKSLVNLYNRTETV